MIWIGAGALLTVASGVLLARRAQSPRFAAVSGFFVVAGAYLAMAHGSLEPFRPGAQLGLYHLFVGDILLFTLVASYHGSLPPRG